MERQTTITLDVKTKLKLAKDKAKRSEDEGRHLEWGDYFEKILQTIDKEAAVKKEYAVFLKK